VTRSGCAISATRNEAACMGGWAMRAGEEWSNVGLYSCRRVKKLARTYITSRAVNDIHDTLGGSLVNCSIIYHLLINELTTMLIALRSTTTSEPGSAQTSSTTIHHYHHLPLLSAISNTTSRSLLASYVEKVRVQEDVMAKHDAIKREVDC